MAIHRNDDYEKLAKLIYPSIEASGNVYYGQTKKLTMDEFLGKNDFGFESHIESFTVEDKDADYGFKYINCLCWKLGPLKDEIILDPEYGMFPLTSIYGYAKYELVVSDDKKYTDTYAGTFTTYERSISLNLPYEIIQIDNGKDPYGEDAYDGRNFYINSSDNVTWYLYVPIVIHNDDDEYGEDEPSDRPAKNQLYIRSFDVGATITLVAVGNFTERELNILNNRNYRYNIDKTGWQDLSISNPTAIHINAHQTVFFEAYARNDRIELYDDIEFTLNKHLQFMITSDESPSGGEECSVEVGGRINSIQRLATPFCYCRLFKNCTNIVSAKNLIILNKVAAAGYCCEMFSGCTSLLTPPEVILQTAECSHKGMFSGCTSITRSPKLLATAPEGGCYLEMFKGCTNLKRIWCVAKPYEKREDGIGRFTFVLQYAVGPMNHEIRFPNLVGDNWLTDAKNDGILYCQDRFKIPGRIEIVTPHDAWDGLVPNEYSFGTYSEAGDFFYDDFYVEESGSQEDQEDEFIPTYKRDYLVTSGSTSDVSYGRGDVTDKSTVTNMKTVNPLFDADAPEMDTYNSDGSFNQNVWGWKCFNGPVSFRNGIYGENASLITDTVDPRFNHGESYNASSFVCKNGDKEAKVTVVSDGESSSVILSGDSIYLDGIAHIDSLNVDRTNKIVSSDYENILLSGEINSLQVYSNIEAAESDVNIGSSSSRFNTVYASSIDCVQLTSRSGSIEADTIKSPSIQCDSISADTDNTTISIASSVIPGSSQVSLGADEDMFSAVYTKKIYYLGSIFNEDPSYNRLSSTESEYIHTNVTNRKILYTYITHDLPSYDVIASRVATELISDYNSNRNTSSNTVNLCAGTTEERYKANVSISYSYDYNKYRDDHSYTGESTITLICDTLMCTANTLELYGDNFSLVVDGSIDVIYDITCRGDITTYNSIKPVIRTLEPTGETVTALQSGSGTYDANYAKETIRQKLDDIPDNLGLDNNTIEGIISAFSRGEMYSFTGGIAISPEAKEILTNTPIHHLGINKICVIAPDNDRALSATAIIGLQDNLNSSYNGYFNEINANSLGIANDATVGGNVTIAGDLSTTGSVTTSRLNTDTLSIDDTLIANTIITNSIQVHDSDTGQFNPKSKILFNTEETLVDESGQNNNVFTVERYVSIITEYNTETKYEGEDTIDFIHNRLDTCEYKFTRNAVYPDVVNRNNVERPELGTTDNPWKSLHVESIYFTHDILPDTIDGHYINLGSDDRKFGSLYLYDTLLTNRIAVGYDILPVSGFDPSIGSNELRFKNIYAKNIYSEQINSVIGNINQFSTFADVEIGTVILAVIRPRNRITNGIGLKLALL